ncbi:hypothetical protein [Methylosinus sp. Sm6]|uniref:hypothetical protein n=1 Tax=Methylosinus sp. Sm6 TaxID=2866948 RepID=UPI001C991D38|nr:hypothetical protein [Methylosinus sp. Sm6]MBY6240464.1 hypothetical protein [Methylosinus sp. Sm6]
MSMTLEMALAPERLGEGSPEERAAFGLFTIRSAHGFLTEGFDTFINGYRSGPLVSGYHVAEWLAWNWWRLRWEPRSTVPGWDNAHRMTAIGEGYVWPNVTIFSDGLRTALLSAPSSRSEAKPFRYVGALPTVIPSTAFEAASDAFILQILGRLKAEGIKDSNLSRLWDDLSAERNNPYIAKRRKLEAYLGRDPDAVEDDAVERLVADAAAMGDTAVEEIAADSRAEKIFTAADIRDLAGRYGHHGSPRDAVRLDSAHKVPRGADTAAWFLGARLAQELRAQEKLGATAISDRRLAELAGTKVTALTAKDDGRSAKLSFVLDEGAMDSRIVLWSVRRTSRRFNLARLIGDRLIDASGTLHPATRASTYRQKAQRAFAAELLSPFDAVDEFLAGDYSAEKQDDAAGVFNVSEMTINSLLKNNGRIPRDDRDFEFENPSA